MQDKEDGVSALVAIVIGRRDREIAGLIRRTDRLLDGVLTNPGTYLQGIGAVGSIGVTSVSWSGVVSSVASFVAQLNASRVRRQHHTGLHNCSRC